MNLPSKSGEYDVTPEIAEAWLERNPEHNRHMSVPKVKAFEAAIREGRFKTTHQGVAFDTNGELLDGQKRLRAIANTGITQRMWVFVNQDPENFQFVDTGQRRTAQQFVHGPYATLRTGAARIMYQAQHNLFGGVSIPADLVLDVHDEWEEELTAYAPDARRINRESPGIPASTLLAVFVQTSPEFNTESGQQAEFIEAFSQGTSQDSPVGRLLKKAAQERSNWRGGGASSHYPYRCLVLTWNAWAARKPTVRLPMNSTILGANDGIPSILGKK